MAIVLGVWMILSVVLGGLLLVQHLVALPTPALSNPRLRAAMARRFAADHRWRAMHVMYRSCRCSRRTVAHLQTSRRPSQLDELVVIVDDEGRPGEEDEALRARGFRVEVMTPRELQDRFALKAAPVLVVARPDGELVYLGGYARHKQSDAFEDLAIIADVRRRAPRSTLPVYGCATNARLARTLDPLGLRRW